MKRRNTTVPIRMTPELRDKMLAVAELYGMGMSEFVRYCVNVVIETTVPLNNVDDGK